MARDRRRTRRRRRRPRPAPGRRRRACRDAPRGRRGRGHAQPEQAGVGERGDQRLGQLPVALGLPGASSAAVGARRRAASTGSVTSVRSGMVTDLDHGDDCDRGPGPPPPPLQRPRPRRAAPRRRRRSSCSTTSRSSSRSARPPTSWRTSSPRTTSAPASSGSSSPAFAVSWAWLNYSWFASAYDTDDWVFRLATMVQMVGVIVLSLGLPQMFASLDHGDTLDNRVMVAGYVSCAWRCSSCGGRSRATTPQRRRTARARTWSTLGVAQVGWVALAIVGLADRRRRSRRCAVLVALELAGPLRRRAQGRARRGTRTTSPSATGCS